MNRVRMIGVSVVAAVLVVCLVGSFMTQNAMEHLPFLSGRAGSGSGVQNSLVDQRPWQTAQALAALAVSAEEKSMAREAERLADHEVDQAFAQALRQASAEPRELKGEALELQQRVTELQGMVKDDQARVKELTAKAGADGKADAQAADDLDVAKAQLGLDNDELSDSLEDLARASGDRRGEIQAELTAREAAMKKYDSQTDDVGQVAVISASGYGTLARRIDAWVSQRSRVKLLEQAEQQARDDGKKLSSEHAALEAKAKEAETADAGVKASGAMATGAARVTELKVLAARRNVLSILDDRIGAQQQLATIYARWQQQVWLQHRIVTHLLLQSFAWVAFIVLCTMLASWGLRTLLDRMVHDRRQKRTMQTIVTLGTQLVGLLLVLLVVFGTPSQMPTILGLATAGLTVVFQDFIIAFCGWFVLMGRNGIRVGDWVEIDGTGGEVVEIGLFRTWLLETGNWTANGHPTGRRVSFLNGFAIRGKYFNFSTTGQWMWDEIKVNIPPGEQTYPLIEKIQQTAVDVTAKDAKMAEAEWKRATHDEAMSHFSATPTVDLRPAGAGVDIVVRYVTRAGARLETRNRLFGKVVELMRGEEATLEVHTK
jgi:small-conductance mechanosensitive channel